MQVQRGKRCITQQIRNAPTVIRRATYFISGSLPLVVCNWTHTQKNTSWHWIFPFLFSREKTHRKYNKFYFKKNKLSGYILITATETIPPWSWTSVEIFIMRNSCWTSRTQTNSVGHIKKSILKAINFKDKGAAIQTFEAKIPVRKYVQCDIIFAWQIL